MSDVEPRADVLDVAPPEKPARRRWISIGAMAAAVIIAASVAVASPWSQPTPAAASPAILDFGLAKAADISFAPGANARTDLLRLTSVARAAVAPQPTGNRVQHVETDTWKVRPGSNQDSPPTGVTTTVTQRWTSLDGAQTVIETTGERLGPTGRGLTPLSRVVIPSADQTFPPGQVNPGAVRDLGTTPGQVRDGLLASGGCDPTSPDTVRAQCLYLVVVGLFSQNVVPPDSAALMWTVLANEPGFRSLGRVTDRAGRPAIGISVISSDVPEYRSVLLISTTTGQLVGDEEILIRPMADLDLQAPLVTSFTAILRSEYTSDRPRPR